MSLSLASRSVTFIYTVAWLQFISNNWDGNTREMILQRDPFPGGGEDCLLTRTSLHPNQEGLTADNFKIMTGPVGWPNTANVLNALDFPSNCLAFGDLERSQEEDSMKIKKSISLFPHQIDEQRAGYGLLWHLKPDIYFIQYKTSVPVPSEVLVLPVRDRSQPEFSVR